MTQELTTIRVVGPTKTTPGFLKRQLHGLRLQKQFRAVKDAQAQFEEATKSGDKEAIAAAENHPALNPDTLLTLFESIIAHVLPFIVEPVDREAARAALEECSQEDYEALMREVNGTKEVEEAGDDPTTSQEPASA